MHLRNYRVVRQIDHRSVAGQKFAPQAFYHWLEKQGAIGRAGGGLLRGGLLWV